MYVTTKGYEYLALARTEKILKFTRAEFGQGFLEESDSVLALTELKDKLGELPLIRKEAKGDETIIACQFSNSNGSGGVMPTFWWTELGLYAQILNKDGSVYADEILYGYAYERNKEDADKIDGILQEFTFNIFLKTAGASDVEIVVSTMAFVTEDEFEAHKADLIAHPLNFDNYLNWPGCTRIKDETDAANVLERWVDSETKAIVKAERTTTENEDGSITETLIFYNDDGSVKAKYIITTTQDGEKAVEHEAVVKEVTE